MELQGAVAIVTGSSSVTGIGAETAKGLAARGPTPGTPFAMPIERMWRQQRSFRITEGASEVMKMVIARHVLNTYG